MRAPVVGVMVLLLAACGPSSPDDDPAGWSDDPVSDYDWNHGRSILPTNGANRSKGIVLYPTDEEYACRPYEEGSAETCEHATAEAGAEELQIMVVGYSEATASYSIKISWR